MENFHCEAFPRKAVAIYLFVIASPPKAGVAISSLRSLQCQKVLQSSQSPFLHFKS
jgi:hypothetical protein